MTIIGDNRGVGWRDITLFLAGCLITLSIMWITVGSKFVTRAEATDIVKQQSPYLQDQKDLETRIRLAEKKADTAEARQEEILKKLTAIYIRLGMKE